jgi:nucleoside-diphosphate-sugar epimerase
MTTNPLDLADHLTGIGVIYHIAGATKGCSREDFDRGNAAVTRALVKAAAAVCPEALFVLASSQSAAGPGGTGPLSAYGASKLLAESAVGSMKRWMVVRPPAVIGPGDTASKSLFRLASRGLFLSPLNRGGFAMVSVHDLARLFALLPDCSAADGCILQPSWPELYTWKDFHRLLEGAAGRKILHVRIPAVLLHAAGCLTELTSVFTRESPMMTRGKVREFLCCDWELEDGTTGSLTGWQPEIPVQEAVRESLLWATSCNRTS